MEAARKAVYIVEDDDDIRTTLEECLQAEGYPVEGCSNGREALDRLGAATSVPGLILLDMMMPVMDGVEFVEHMLSREGLRDVPVAVISAGNKVPPIARAFFKKPFDLPRLLEVVKQHCG